MLSCVAAMALKTPSLRSTGVFPSISISYIIIQVVHATKAPSLLKDCPANDDQLNAGAGGKAELLREIARLREALEKCASRIAELERIAHVDPLVQLPNRRSFLRRLDYSVADVHRHGVEGAVLFLDVDGLKSINDKFGHEAGDKALVEVAKLLAASVRTTDVVARLSGDEFAILLERTDELSAWRMAERIVEKVDDCRFCIESVCVDLSIAVGVAMIRLGDTSQAVLTRADREMYRIKALSGP